MRIKNWKLFTEAGLALTNFDLGEINRTKKLSEEEFLETFNNNCKNFSFSNDLLWRSKSKKFDLELFEPNYRNAKPLAFPDFFNKIENDPDYPVIRKKSLIGGTNPKINKLLVGYDNYLVIPFDNSEVVFCPTMDLLAMASDRKMIGCSTVRGGEQVGPQHFIKVKYTQNFRIPREQLDKIRNSLNIDYRGKDNGYEFFISSPCLMIHKDKIDWFNQLKSLK